MSITLGQKTLELPLLQGGMGIGVSRCRLAGAVAHEGAMGVISAAQIGYDQDDFRLHPESANLRELPRQIKRAKALAFGARDDWRQHYGGDAAVFPVCKNRL